MLADFYIRKISNDRHIDVQKNRLRGKMLYSSLDHNVWTRDVKGTGFCGTGHVPIEQYRERYREIYFGKLAGKNGTAKYIFVRDGTGTQIKK